MERVNRRQQISLVGRRRVIWSLVVVGLVLVWPRACWLTDQSRAIARVDTANEKVVWLADSRLLLLSTHREAAQETDQKGDTINIDWQGSVDLIDADTRTRKHLTALTDLLNRTGLAYNSFRTSPDGLWVLWENTYAPAHPRPYVYVAKSDGSACRHWIRGIFNLDLEFYLDARHIIQVANQVPGIIVHNLVNPALDREYMTPKEAQGVLAQYVRLHPAATNVTVNGPQILIGCTTSNAYDPNRNLPYLFSSESPLHDVFKSTQLRQLPLPKGATFLQGVVSPQQQAIFYPLERSQMHPFLAWIHRYLRKVRIEPTVTESLWVSRADGRGMREIGFVPVQPDPDSIQQYHLQNLQWLPDGKHVSYVYRGTLYTMAAEPDP